ncbi:MAG: arsenate reductase ArsC [Bdellovibrionales bacterium]|nr:arsenate reductase ArsC [Bdellovibrionales bacterium]
MKILFLCVANSARSQMAEGLARHYLGDQYEIYSAGSDPSQLNPLAVEVMAEIGIDITQQFSKPIHATPTEQIDLVITLCQDEVCPLFLKSCRREHWPFPDPANHRLDSKKQLESFRIVRDKIREKILERLSN